MILYSTQPQTVVTLLEQQGELHANPFQGTVLTAPECVDFEFLTHFQNAYGWLCEQMKERIPECEGDFPWWGWTERPDLRAEVWQKQQGSENVLLKLRVPDDKVLLTDHRGWDVSTVVGQYYSHTEKEWKLWLLYAAMEDTLLYLNNPRKLKEIDDHQIDQLMDKAKSITDEDWKAHIEEVTQDSWYDIFTAKPYATAAGRRFMRASKPHWQAAFEPLRQEYILEVTPFKGRKNYPKSETG